MDTYHGRRLVQHSGGLLRGQHDPALFTAPMRLFLRTATGKAFWEWTASHGELGSVSYSEHEQHGEARILRYRVLLGGDPYWFSVQLAGDGRIAQIRWW